MRWKHERIACTSLPRVGNLWDFWYYAAPEVLIVADQTRDPVALLHRLEELKMRGVVTESQYRAKKIELLDRIKRARRRNPKHRALWLLAYAFALAAVGVLIFHLLRLVLL
jgi:hypothetical protein